MCFVPEYSSSNSFSYIACYNTNQGLNLYLKKHSSYFYALPSHSSKIIQKLKIFDKCWKPLKIVPQSNVVRKIVRKISIERLRQKRRTFYTHSSRLVDVSGNENVIPMSAKRIDDPTRWSARIFHTKFHEVWTGDKLLWRSDML